MRGRRSRKLRSLGRISFKNCILNGMCVPFNWVSQEFFVQILGSDCILWAGSGHYLKTTTFTDPATNLYDIQSVSTCIAAGTLALLYVTDISVHYMRPIVRCRHICIVIVRCRHFCALDASHCRLQTFLCLRCVPLEGRPADRSAAARTTYG